MSAADADPSFFRGRGIKDEIWQGRYTWWTPDDPGPAREPFADTQPGQRAHIAKITNQSPGWVINRFAPPLNPPLAKVYPELRPLDPVKTQGPTLHWHGDGPEPENISIGKKATFYETLPDWARMPGRRENWQSHIEHRKRLDDGTYKPCGMTDHHHGVNTEEVHYHQALAKYTFLNLPKTDVVKEHDHDTGWKTTAREKRPARRTAHVEKYHGGVDQAGLHPHTWRIKDRSTKLASRIDVNPRGVQRIVDAEVVFFCIEGCIKADAILSAGGAVFSVPAVGQWDCDELRAFCWHYLADKTVVIINDADWENNHLVRNQSRLCRAQLARYGVYRVHIAAPEPFYEDRETKGVDDWLGAGGELEGLRVIETHPPTDRLHEWIAARARRKDQAGRDESLLWWLAAYTGPSGELWAPFKTVTKVLGTNGRSISDSIHSLETMGALTIDGDLMTKPHWPTYREDWVDRPRLTLIPELRAQDNQLTLGEATRLPLRTTGGSQ